MPAPLGNKNHQGKHRQASAVATPTVCDIAWVAGFLEGEGCFYDGFGANRATTEKRKNGIMLAVSQVDPEPIRRLQALVGGTVRKRRTTTSTGNEVWCWSANGTRARGIAMTVYPLMSERRKAAIRGMLK